MGVPFVCRERLRLDFQCRPATSARLQLATRSHHGPPQFVRPSPRGLITPQSQLPLESDGAATVLLPGDGAYRSEPKREGLARVLENCPGSHRTLIATVD